MGSLSKNVPHPHDNFLLSACQFTASSQGNGKFTEFVCLHKVDSIFQKSPKFYLVTHYLTYSPKFFFANSLFCPFAKVFHHQSFPLYSILYACSKLAFLYVLVQVFIRHVISQQVDDLLNSLQDEISFTADQILTEETRDSLRQYSSAGLQSIDYLGYTNQINATTSNLDVNGVITSMQMVHMEFDAANQVNVV